MSVGYPRSSLKKIKDKILLIFQYVYPNSYFLSYIGYTSKSPFIYYISFIWTLIELILGLADKRSIVTFLLNTYSKYTLLSFTAKYLFCFAFNNNLEALFILLLYKDNSISKKTKKVLTLLFNCNLKSKNEKISKCFSI